MASRPLPLPLSNTLSYFAKYDYPLTTEELWYWQHRSKYSLAQIKKFYNKKLSPIRIKKEKISLVKWKKAFAIGTQLSKVPNILAVFVTGSLSMNNAVKGDDIDLMIVVRPQTLWITRLVVNILFSRQRRKPRIQKVANKVCFNLWLDTNNLKIKKQDNYLAHEILQAKLLWERASIYQMFLQQNKWVKRHLPIAYRESVKKYTKTKIADTNMFILLINLFSFSLQYIYMWPKKTSETVSIGTAFFHPVNRAV